MSEKRLNNCMLLHIHKDKTDTLSNMDIAKEFISLKTDRLSFFGSLDF